MARPVKATTVLTYYRYLSSLFSFLETDGALEESPFRKKRVKAPIVRKDQIQPFNRDQLNALLSAARASVHPRRNEAIILILLDTGMRASELCALKRGDVDHAQKSCLIHGKGNKTRTVPFERHTAKSIWRYLTEVPGDDSCSLFTSDRGRLAGDPLTRSGLLQIVAGLGKVAKITGVRCSPHTFRHTFAVEYLRGGGQVLALKELLGHTNLQMTDRYVRFSNADMVTQHRQFSPVNRLLSSAHR